MVEGPNAPRIGGQAGRRTASTPNSGTLSVVSRVRKNRLSEILQGPHRSLRSQALNNSERLQTGGLSNRERDQPLRSQPARSHQLVAALAHATPLPKEYRASKRPRDVCVEGLNKTLTVRKQVKNDVNICATIYLKAVYDVEGEQGQGPELSRDPQFFLKAQCRRDQHRE